MTTSTPESERTLILVRHAKAEHAQDRPDHERRLAQRGRRDAEAVGVWLSRPSDALIVDLALCSTSVRTRQTLDGICAAGAFVKESIFDERIYGASAVGLLELLREVQDQVTSVMIVGHAPGIPVLATALAQDDLGSTDLMDELSLAFPTSGVAVLGFAGSWAELAPETAHLREFVVPRGDRQG